MRKCDKTAPPFCANPIMSRIPIPFFSRCAAIPSKAPIVTIPVPPTPVKTMLYVSLITGSFGSGKEVHSTSILAEGAFFLIFPPMTLTKLGHKPLTQL